MGSGRESFVTTGTNATTLTNSFSDHRSPYSAEGSVDETRNNDRFLACQDLSFYPVGVDQIPDIGGEVSAHEISYREACQDLSVHAFLMESDDDWRPVTVWDSPLQSFRRPPKVCPMPDPPDQPHGEDPWADLMTLIDVTSAPTVIGGRFSAPGHTPPAH
eukprot:CAMPEP_0181293314 /NCGR_PEP_ID=MMETSP1101-20121128/2998_1 /TAXON_ID=46948 /ORGANISM="Rhodomonas abbreviata, Strain Caron Lab Isolate" /LENGTH=159 /DNA_ID=CAMNT_0023397891 /DNA_START=84 /DNA_END=563 /DNA_ORIENTATION=-